MLLVGSQAAKFHFPEARHSDVLDIWVADNDVNAFVAFDKLQEVTSTCATHNQRNFVTETKQIINLHTFSSGSSESLFIRSNKKEKNTIIKGFGPVSVATPATLYLIKKSHIYSANEWHKHILDMHFLKKNLSRNLPSESELDAYAQRSQEFSKTEKKINSMAEPNESFFSGYRHSFIRRFPHDQLHKATCYYADPLYVRLKENHNLALTLKCKFDDFSYEDKIRTVKEEAFVFALERVIIPSRDAGKTWSEKHAYDYAVRTLCTNTARGWFREFAVDNYPQIKNSGTSYFIKFSNAEKAGYLEQINIELPNIQRISKVNNYLQLLENENVQAGLAANG